MFDGPFEYQRGPALALFALCALAFAFLPGFSNASHDREHILHAGFADLIAVNALELGGAE